jgi:lipopolysaccharide export system protein LptA
MPISVLLLRRWFLGAAIVAVLVVAGVWFYARHRVENALKEVPEKIGLNIQQTATGFSISKSEQGRTLFKVEASRAVQFKGGMHAELHNVSITLYGRDSSRFDKVYGDQFEYDQQTGDVTAEGEVQIDLEANPQGIIDPDQAAPRELKNPIHLKTSGLTFNQKSGDAYTKNKVEFTMPQATGSALGAHYIAKTNTLTLDSQVAIQVSEPFATITAARGVITKDPRWIVLEQPAANEGQHAFSSDQATLFLRDNNTLDHMVASGNVFLRSKDDAPAEARASELQVTLSEANTLRSAILTGNVQADAAGPQPVHAAAGRVIFDFASNQTVQTVHAEDKVKISQRQNSSSTAGQNLDLTTDAVDFILSHGQRLDRAETNGAAQIAISQAVSQGESSLLTAGKFDARFDKEGKISLLHGAPDARIVNKNPGQPDRVSTSDTLDATFHSGSGIESLVQEGHVAYSDGERKAWGERAKYTPADQILTLTGSPKVSDGGMTTTARSMRVNRATGDALADGDVKSTYSDMKPSPNGALLASGSPIHVTSKSMTVHGTPAIALYSGNARLWQDANAVDAPTIQFDRDTRSVIAYGTAGQTVSTVLEQPDKSGKLIPVAITSSRLSYADEERRARFEGNVVVKGSDMTITAAQMDAYLQKRGQLSSTSDSPQAARLEKIVALGDVVITQPTRQATGKQLVYSTIDDKFVLTGGPPSIFDAERGKITGDSLTLFRQDGRVVVEGSNSAPTITETRVAR